MKQVFKVLSLLLFAATMSFNLSSCSDKETEEPSDYGKTISGTYAGTLETNGTILEDAYVVTVTRVSDTVVNVAADFFGDSGSCNFNVEYSNGIYTLTSRTVSNISMSVKGNTLTISYTNMYGNLVTYTGTK